MPRPLLNAAALAERLGGRLEGDGTVAVSQMVPLDRAGPADLSFLISARYLTAFRQSLAGAVIVSESVPVTSEGPATRIVVLDVVRALAAAAEVFRPPPMTPEGVDPDARIAADVVSGPGTHVGPFAVVEAGVRLGARTQVGAGAWLGAGFCCGEDCLIGPRVACYPGTTLGSRVILKAGAVIGGPGFRFLRGVAGHGRLPHLGGCVLEDDVEVGSGSCIDRGGFEDTVIGRGTKIDNLVQIGHNVRLGADCLVMAMTGIAGSCRIGDDVIIAGGVGIADHVTIGDGATIGAKSVVFGPGIVPAGAVVSGYPARPHRLFLRAQATLYRLAARAADDRAHR
ncbi:MAG: UDP-3-O-(3-hydroxymyristoyl)glucosamine N-acyltransferase [Gemmatimonadota bacterium]|nr:UDP-3-O-(3-hydroxymyristoyl)glucosamine N-acyltransferase [Gemmatimonadota bacterium]